MERGTPSPIEIKDIFKYIYLWFEKYKDSSTDDDFVNMIDDGKKIRDKYNFKFTEDLIIGLEEVIEEYYRAKTRR